MSRTKLNKTLREGKPDEDTRVRYELAIKVGEAAIRVSNCCGKRATPKCYASMQADLEILTQDGYGITENIARQWTSEVAAVRMSKRLKDEFCKTLRTWRLRGEAVQDSAEFVAFDLEHPMMWKVTPTDVDEERAFDTTEKPEPPAILAELMEFQREQAFDKSVQSFAHTLRSAWACDAVYELLAKDMAESTDLMKTWVAMATSADREDSGVGQRSLKATQNITTFAQAYLVVTSDRVLDGDSYDAYTSVFVPTNGKTQLEFFKLLAAVSRKNEEFRSREQKLNKMASSELKSSRQVLDLMELSNEMSMEIVDKVALALPDMRANCRPGITDQLSERTAAWLEARVSILCMASAEDGDAIAITAEAAVDLKTASKHLPYFCQILPERADLPKSRERCDQAILGI